MLLEPDGQCDLTALQSISWFDVKRSSRRCDGRSALLDLAGLDVLPLSFARWPGVDAPAISRDPRPRPPGWRRSHWGIELTAGGSARRAGSEDLAVDRSSDYRGRALRVDVGDDLAPDSVTPPAAMAAEPAARTPATTMTPRRRRRRSPTRWGQDTLGALHWRLHRLVILRSPPGSPRKFRAGVQLHGDSRTRGRLAPGGAASAPRLHARPSATGWRRSRP
jgi:hypothetical protein